MTLTRHDVRALLTILMYAGIIVFFAPFLIGKSHNALWFHLRSPGRGRLRALPMPLH